MVKRRYFGPMLRAQAKWLNKMSAQGWRLAGTGKLDYTFVPCELGKYQYAVAFVGNLQKCQSPMVARQAPMEPRRRARREACLRVHDA